MEGLTLEVGDAFFQFSWSLLGESMQKSPQALWLAPSADGAAPSQEDGSQVCCATAAPSVQSRAGDLFQPSRDLVVGFQ